MQNLSRELAHSAHDVAIVTWSTPPPAFEVEGDVRIYRLSGTMQRLPFLYSDTGRRFAPPFPDPGADLGPEGHRGPRAAGHARPQLAGALLPAPQGLERGPPRAQPAHEQPAVRPQRSDVPGGPCSGPALAEVRRVLRRPLRPGQGAAHPPSPTGPCSSPPGPRWTTTSPSATPWAAASGLLGAARRTRSCRSSSPTTWPAPGRPRGRWPSSPGGLPALVGGRAGSRGSRSCCRPTPGWRPPRPGGRRLHLPRPRRAGGVPAERPRPAGLAQPGRDARLAGRSPLRPRPFYLGRAFGIVALEAMATAKPVVAA